MTTHDGSPLIELTYGNSATIRVANVGRRRRKDASDRGFWIDTIQGRWLSDKKATDTTVDSDGLEADLADVETRAKVIPYVEDTRNVLVLRHSRQLDDVMATSLRYALERGIEACFQLEDSELDSNELPDPSERGRALFTESSEGGAGVLRRLVSEPDALARVARSALERAHFDPDTGADLDHAPGAGERCEKACYDCLLSYGNQLDHARIDRHVIRDALLEIAGAVTHRASSMEDEPGGSALEHELDGASPVAGFLAWLGERGYRRPDRVDVVVDDARAHPDLVYRLSTGQVAVFIDSPDREIADPSLCDTDAEERLIDSGWSVIRFATVDEWPTVVAKFPSVFGEGHME